ncbi:hypothetical protein OIO90_006454 [Microbotryomycetes sp. JL221]|nr:hypothetical protein OIO90_006454 [Microbotryomycetes sp. JL221]
MAGSHPPRPGLHPRSITMATHSPSPSTSSSSADSSSTTGSIAQPPIATVPQRHASLSEKSSSLATTSTTTTTTTTRQTPADVKRQFVATGNERVFPMRNVVQARPSTSRTKTTLGNPLMSPQQPASLTTDHRSTDKKPIGTMTSLSFGGPLTTGPLTTSTLVGPPAPTSSSSTGTLSSPQPHQQPFTNPFANSFSKALSINDGTTTTTTNSTSEGTMSPGGSSSHPATTPGLPDFSDTVGFSPKMVRRRSTAGWYGPASQSSGKNKNSTIQNQTTKVTTTDGHVFWKLNKELTVEEESKHRPSCIQSFGVVVALEEDDAGNFVVQQVSENSGEIISLSPAVLFDATSFTIFLTSDSTDVFLDAIDALEDSDPISKTSSDEESIQSSINSEQQQQETSSKSLPHPEHFRLSIVPGCDQPNLSRSSSDESQSTSNSDQSRSSTTTTSINVYASLHRPDPIKQPNRTILELELVDDVRNPLKTDRDVSSPQELDKDRRLHDNPIEHSSTTTRTTGSTTTGMDATAEEIYKSTVSLMKPIRALNRKRTRRDSEINMVQLVFQIEEQLRKAKGLETFLSVTAGIFKELTGFDRSMILQFDENWHARVVAEQVDRVRTRDLYLDLTFPASDVASASFATTKLSLLYNREGERIPMLSKTQKEAQNPIDMTRCMLRALPKARTDYLEKMGVRATMTVSLFAFGKLWGIVQLSSHGPVGHRVSVPIRNLCSYLGESLSRTIERLSYERRLQARRIINTSASTENPSGTFIASGDELLTLFGADFGCLNVGEEAKIMGDVPNAQELLAVLEYLRAQAFTTIQMSQEISNDFPDCRAPDPNGFQQIAGLLLIPLSPTGVDFIVFIRKGQPQETRWAGSKPGEFGEPLNQNLSCERKGFEVYRQVSSGKARPWNDEVAETAEVLGVIYSRFINVWREKETAVHANSVTSLLLANASHEVRTPLNAIVNFLEMALDASTDGAVNENLRRTHDASKSLVHVINDLLDLTRQESGGELFTQEPFEIAGTIDDAISIQREEAKRKGLNLDVIEDPLGTPKVLIGDRAKIRQIIATSVGNAVKYTDEGSITIKYGEYRPTTNVETNVDGVKRLQLGPVSNSGNADKAAITTTMNSEIPRDDARRLYISIIDSGRGIADHKLEALFDALHHVKKASKTIEPIGLGLAVSARLIENLGGFMSVESQVGKGSKFTFVIPFAMPDSMDSTSSSPSGNVSRPNLQRRSSSHSTGSRTSLNSRESRHSEIDNLITAITTSHIDPKAIRTGLHNNYSSLKPRKLRDNLTNEARGVSPRASSGNLHCMVTSSSSSASATPTPTTPHLLDPPTLPPVPRHRDRESTTTPSVLTSLPEKRTSFHVLVVEDEKINRVLLERRLVKDGHVVTVVEHGGLAVRAMEEDPTAFDLILMDLNMPICDGYEASRIIRESEPNYIIPPGVSKPISHVLNGRIPIIAVSANIHERNRKQLISVGIDAWTLKPVRFNRLQEIMKGAIDVEQRQLDVYRPGINWEFGGWFRQTDSTRSTPATPVVDVDVAKF